MPELTFDELRKILPQAYPFLMIDRVVDYKEGESLVAVKNITANEWCFEGDPENGVFPETLLMETAAQAGIILHHLSKIKEGENPIFFLGKTTANFLGQAKIGDQLQIKVSNGKMLDTSGYCTINILSKEEKIADVEIFYKVKK
ncbi:MAG: 3-hydroxyacyl-ACP dehydratase FabZ family protein [Candidatus Omnitrophota bacterium]